MTAEEQELIQLREENHLLREQAGLQRQLIERQQEQIGLLEKQNGLQEHQIALLTEQLKVLQEKLSKDSHNSHLPPSSDRFHRQPKSLRKKSTKASGGQAGHPGKHLMMVETPDQILVHTPERCARCAQDLSCQPVEKTIRRQVFDLPLARMLVCEHQAQSKRCSHCQAITMAAFPEGVSAPVQYGASIQAIGVYLSQMQLLPDERVCQIMKDLLAVAISSGSLHNWMACCAHTNPRSVVQ